MPLPDIHAGDFRDWLRWAIQIKREQNRKNQDGAALSDRRDELVIVASHLPRLRPAPASEQVCVCCSNPWPCKQILITARDYRGQVGWPPHWDELLKELIT